MNKLKTLFTSIMAIFMISLVVAFSAPVAASDVILYGTSTGFGTGEQGSGGTGPGTGPGNFSQFHRVDFTTGVATEISMDIGFGGDVGGLAADSNDVLFAGTGGRGPNLGGRSESPSLLFTIDPVTGLGNPEIGPLGIEFGPPESAGQGPGAGDFEQFGSRRQNISGWSFDPISGNLYGMAARGSQLFTADTTTGLATRVGTACDSPQIFAPGGSCRRGNAIAFDDVGVNTPLGTLFWANELEIAELDPATGLIVGTPVSLDFFPFFTTPHDAPAVIRVVALDFHPVTGDLYAAVQKRQAQDSPPPKSTIAILDPLLGTFTVIGAIDSTGEKLDGIAFTHPDADERLTLESVILVVLAEIDALLMDPGVSEKAKKKLRKAEKKLEKALRKLEKGDIKKALKEIAKAVKELVKAEKEGADVSHLIDLLIEASRAEAQDAIDTAIAIGGKPKEIDKALEEMSKAQKELDKGKPDKAINHYSHAWGKAQKAVK